MTTKKKALPALITKLGCYPQHELNLVTQEVRGRAVTLQARALRNFAEVLYPAFHHASIPLTVVSSFRSCALQCELIKEHGGDCAVGIPGIVAAPGHSYHNIALAVDLYPPAPPLIPHYRRLMDEHNWHNFAGVHGSDPNHWTWRVTG